MPLIELDDLIRAMRQEDKRTPGIPWSISGVQNLASQIPTREAAPVVHGRWEKCWQEKSRHYFRCSNCQTAYMDGVSGAIAPEYGSRAWRYCPNCGAKMDGGVSDG